MGTRSWQQLPLECSSGINLDEIFTHSYVGTYRAHHWGHMIWLKWQTGCVFMVAAGTLTGAAIFCLLGQLLMLPRCTIWLYSMTLQVAMQLQKHGYISWQLFKETAMPTTCSLQSVQHFFSIRPWPSTTLLFLLDNSAVVPKHMIETWKKCHREKGKTKENHNSRLGKYLHEK